MKILVIDVAAEYGGAKTVLDQFISDFKNDKENHYLVVLGKLDYKDFDNVSFLRKEWVKKSYFHRLFFDYFFSKKIVKQYKPDLVLSLQNKTIGIRKIPQEVFFHNALPISQKKFKFFESKKLWFYQNIVGRIFRKSLKRADKIYVQAKWIKDALIKKWRLPGNCIIVKPPRVDFTAHQDKHTHSSFLFYPANGELYKNHERLILALFRIWKDQMPENRFPLVLSGTLTDLPINVQKMVKNNANFPISFAGKLSKDMMAEYYSKSILVFPSYIETVGLPLLEARMTGCTIISSDCEYSREVLSGYQDVFYFNPEKVESIQEAIECCLKKAKLL